MNKSRETDATVTPWLAPDDSYLPDFIICGAMKCGTTSLHNMLNCHPDVFIPDKELHFFDLDNIAQHPEFNVFSKNVWSQASLESAPERYWQWYKEQFSDALDGQIKGEDSTTYIASIRAAKRIASQHKDIKLVIMLRHPTARVYSHYWHMVRAGKAMFNFERTLQYQPYNLLDRSLYLGQLKNLFDVIDPCKVRVILFEDFIADPKLQVAEVCRFLGVDASKMPRAAFSIHDNPSSIPRFLNVHLLKCRLFREMAIGQQRTPFPNQEQLEQGWSRYAEKLYTKLNPLIVKKPPRINPETQLLLDNYFYNELVGLDELLGKRVLSRWFKGK